MVPILNAFEAGQVVEQGLAAAPSASILARAHADAEVEGLAGLGADLVLMGERELMCAIVERPRLTPA